ncbi:MAG: hypothetical protein U9N38_05005 [Thermodesulfobacteriota bacterium]|nr:hypothetical protein [Thermodesulfobacteriota bacterium]
MKKMVSFAVFTCFFFFTALACGGVSPLDLKVKAEIWTAQDSKYTETSSVPGSNAPHGCLDTNFFKLTVEKAIGKALIEGALTQGNILSQRMFIDAAESQFVRIEGTIQLAELSGYYRVGIPFGNLDMGMSYLYSSTKKEFYDYSSGGVPDPARQGNFGRFMMVYHGPAAKIRARADLGPIGIEGSGYYGLVWNNVQVEGWPGGKTDDNANGRRCAIEGAAIWNPFPLVELKGGYRYESIYFNPPADGKHDLDITFRGPFASLSVSF